MILHIFRKDLRRLWPLVAGLVLAHFVFVAIQLNLLPALNVLRDFSRFLGGNGISGPMIPPVNIITLLGFFLAVMVVQLDPVPGDRQDWLVRPLRRRDLLLAKLLFAAAAIQAPMLAADLAQGLGAGSSFGLIFSEAVWRNLYHFFVLSLPGLMLGALTRTIGQMLGLVTAVCFGAMVTLEVVAISLFPTFIPDMGGTVTPWVFRTLLFLGAGAAILGLQYFRRATAFSRLLFVAVIVLMAGSQILLPRSAAFAMQAWLLPQPEVSLVLAAKVENNGHEAAPGVTVRSILQGRPQPGARVAGRILVPLRVENLAAGRILAAESMQAFMRTADGERLQIGFPGNRLLVAPDGNGRVFTQALTLLPEQVEKLRGRQGRLELEYVLAVLQPETSTRLDADGSPQMVADGLRCTSRVGETVTLQCRLTGQARMGVTAALAGQDVMALLALPSNAPYSRGANMLNDLASSLPLTDRTQLPQVTVTLSRPLGYVLRRVVIENFRPGAWQGGAP